MGKPTKITIGDKSLFVCCAGCTKKVEASPDQNLTKYYNAKGEQVREGVFKSTLADAAAIVAQKLLSSNKHVTHGLDSEPATLECKTRRFDLPSCKMEKCKRLQNIEKRCQDLQELNLADDAPLCPWRLAEHLEIPIHTLVTITGFEPNPVAYLLGRGRTHFSAATLFRGKHGLSRVIFHNEPRDRL
jgi:hypothetical protein